MKRIVDSDMCKVWLASLVPTSLTLAQASYVMTILAGLLSCAYTLKKLSRSNWGRRVQTRLRKRRKR